MNFSSDYASKPLNGHVITPILDPNFSKKGHICLNIFRSHNAR